MKTHLSKSVLLSVSLLASTACLSAQSPSGAAPGTPATDSPAVDAPKSAAPTAPAANTADTQAAAAAATTAPAAANNTAPAVNLPQAKILPTGDTTTPVGSTLTGRLDAGRTSSTIGNAEFETRDELLRELSERVAAADTYLNELRQRTRNLDATDQRSVDTAVAEYQKMKEKVQQGIERARAAQQGSDWERARSALATDYAFYVSSVGSLEVALPN
jgi:chemotaxis protein histidine kinase CheA